MYAKLRPFCAFLLCGAASIAPGARADGLAEYAVKAVYLTKFVPFIEWPAAVLATPTAPVTICVIGEDPFGVALDRAAAGAGAGRPLVVRRIPEVDAGTGTLCQIVYVADSQVGYDAVDALRSQPVLTVTDSNMRARGIINFLTLDNHIRFDIDDDAAERKGIKISSKLLGLARSVIRKGTP